MTIKSDFSGLKKLSENVKKLGNEQSVPINELLHDDFIQRKTSFNSLDEIFEKSGFKIESKEDFETIPQEDLDKFISENSEYDAFNDLLGAAGAEYVQKTLFKGLK